MTQTNFLLTALKHPMCGNWMTWLSSAEIKQYFEAHGQPLSDLELWSHILKAGYDGTSQMIKQAVFVQFIADHITKLYYFHYKNLCKYTT